jgi:putative addiction module CopG family antidote
MAKPITTTLPDDLVRFAEAQVAAGRFARVEDVIEAGVLKRCARRQERHDAKAQALAAALEEGERSGLADDGVFDRVRARHGLSSAR